MSFVPDTVVFGTLQCLFYTCYRVKHLFSFYGGEIELMFVLFEGLLEGKNHQHAQKLKYMPSSCFLPSLLP